MFSARNNGADVHFDHSLNLYENNCDGVGGDGGDIVGGVLVCAFSPIFPQLALCTDMVDGKYV